MIILTQHQGFKNKNQPFSNHQRNSTASSASSSSETLKFSNQTSQNPIKTSSGMASQTVFRQIDNQQVRVNRPNTTSSASQGGISSSSQVSNFPSYQNTQRDNYVPKSISNKASMMGNQNKMVQVQSSRVPGQHQNQHNQMSKENFNLDFHAKKPNQNFMRESVNLKSKNQISIHHQPNQKSVVIFEREKLMNSKNQQNSRPQSKPIIEDYEAIKNKYNIQQPKISQVFNQELPTMHSQYYSQIQLEAPQSKQIEEKTQFTEKDTCEFSLERYNSLENHLMSQSYDKRFVITKTSSKLTQLNQYSNRESQDFLNCNIPGNISKTSSKMLQTKHNLGGESASTINYTQESSNKDNLYDYPQKVNLSKRFDDLAQIDEKHRKSLDDMGLTNETLDSRFEKNKPKKKKSVAQRTSKASHQMQNYNNNNTLTKESLQVFLQRAKQNLDMKNLLTNRKTSEKNQQKEYMSKDKKQHTAHQYQQSVCNFQKSHAKNASKNLMMDEYQVGLDLSSSKKQLNLGCLSQLGLINSPYSNQNKISLGTLQSSKSHKKSSNLNEQALSLFIKKRNESINQTTKNNGTSNINHLSLKSSERQKANSLIRNDESMMNLNSFVGDKLYHQTRQTIIKPSNTVNQQSKRMLSSIEGLKESRYLQPQIQLTEVSDFIQTEKVNLNTTIQNNSQLSPHISAMNKKNYFENLMNKSKAQQAKSPSSRFTLNHYNNIKQSVSPQVSRNNHHGFTHNSSVQLGNTNQDVQRKQQIEGGLNCSQNQLKLKNETAKLNISQNQLFEFENSRMVQNKRLQSNDKGQVGRRSSLHDRIKNNVSESNQLLTNKSKIQRKRTTLKDTESIFRKVTEDDNEVNEQSFHQPIVDNIQKAHLQDVQEVKLVSTALASHCLSACKSPSGFKKHMHYNQPKMIRKYKNLYNKIITEKKSEYQQDIQKDLDRTFPQMKYFAKGNQGQDYLERILTAISIYYKKLGYVQGMNLIVGSVLVSFQNEEDAFWMMISMLVNFKLDQLLTFENNKFKILCFQIDMFVKAYLPNLYEMFKDTRLLQEFAWQCLKMLKVNIFIVNIIIAQLFDLSFDESLVKLKTFGRSLDCDTETFFQMAMSFRITKQMCKDLEQFYQEQYLSKTPQSKHAPPFESEFDLEFDYAQSKFYIIKRKPKSDSTTQGDTVENKYTHEIDEFDIKTMQDQKAKKGKNNQQNGGALGVNSLGQKMNNFLNWFKKDKKSVEPDDQDDQLEDFAINEVDVHSDEIISDRDRSGEIEDQVPMPNCFIVTPQSQQIKSIKDQILAYSKQSKEYSAIKDSTSQSEILNESQLLQEMKEGPRFLLPEKSLNQQYHRSKLQDKGYANLKYNQPLSCKTKCLSDNKVNANKIDQISSFDTNAKQTNKNNQPGQHMNILSIVKRL